MNRSIIIGLILSICLVSMHSEQLQISNVDRQLMLNGQYATQQTLISFESQELTFKHFVPQSIQQRISKIAFMRNKQNKQFLPYTKQKYIYNGEKYTIYKVEFNVESNQIYVVTVFLNRYVNFPKEINMIEDQKFQFTDNKWLVSSYNVAKQTSTYKFDKILDHEKDGQLKGLSTVVFKKIKAEPFSTQTHTVHGVNNDPQVYFTKVERTLEVSHWGNIAITEFYSIENTGPTLKGEFSRLTFSSQSQADSKNAFRGIQSTLPYQTWGLYYRDEVGNISTSKAYRDEYQNKVKLALVPRFSLLGGWKANWELGYNLPATKFLYSQANNYQLDNIDLEYTLEKVVAETYDLKITLPEGVKNVKVKLAGVQVQPTRIDKTFGILDFFGKPTYVFEDYQGILKKKDITVDYQLDTLSALYKPIIIFVAIFLILAVSIVLKRLKLDAFTHEKQN